MSRGRSLAAALERSRTAAADLATGAARPRRTVPVALDAIRIEDRLRGRLDAEQVARIAESMRDIGLQSPVVLRPYREAGLFALVAGAHRIEAAQRLGWTEIEALVADIPPDEARLVEIDENLARAELSALDRARFLAARKEIYERLHPETRHGGARAGKQAANLATCSEPAAFAEDAGQRTGLSQRTVRRAVRIGTELAPELANALDGTPLADRQRDLERLAGLPPEEQRRVAKRIRASGEPPKTLDAAVGRAGGNAGRPARRGTSESRRLAALRQAWRMANQAEREAFLHWIGEGRSQAADAADMETGHAREHASIEGRKT